MEKIQKLVRDFKALTNDEKLDFIKEAMSYVAEIFANDPKKMMAEMMSFCMNMAQLKGLEMNRMSEMMKSI